MWLRYLQRCSIRLSQPTPYSQQYIHKIWEGHPLSNADNYQYVARVLYVTVWFAEAAPLGVIFALVALLLNYWIDKVFLLRVNSLPEALSEDIASAFLLGLEWLPLVYVCGNLQYTYKVGHSSNVLEFLYDFLNYGIVLVVIILSLGAYVFIWRRPQPPPVDQSTFKQVQYLFQTSYDLENPITRFQSQLEFLKRLLADKELDQESQHKVQTLISQLERKNTTRQDLEKTNPQILGLKQSLAESVHRKLSVRDTEMLPLNRVPSNP